MLKVRWGLRSRVLGLVLVLLGLVLMGSGAAYFLYADRARAGLEGLNYTPPADEQQVLGTYGLELAPELNSSPQAQPKVIAVEPTQVPASEEAITSSIPAQAIQSQRLYPGEYLPARYWPAPDSYQPPSISADARVQGFQPIDWVTLPQAGSLSRATRLIIPAIDVDSSVQELKIDNLGDSRAYETPKNTVGHIPETSSAGEQGTAWFFGHLESPIRGEGSVFRDLPKVPGLLKSGEEVNVIVENPEASYLYRISSTQVVHESAIYIHELGSPSIVLVTCVPRLVYDHRLLVIGQLVGVRPKV